MVLLLLGVGVVAAHALVPVPNCNDDRGAAGTDLVAVVQSIVVVAAGQAFACALFVAVLEPFLHQELVVAVAAIVALKKPQENR